MSRRFLLLDRLREDFAGITVHESDDRLLIEVQPESIPALAVECDVLRPCGKRP